MTRMKKNLKFRLQMAAYGLYRGHETMVVEGDLSHT